MKNNIVKAAIAGIFSLSVSLVSSAQTRSNADIGKDKDRSKIESSRVPAEVKKHYEKDYPLTPIKSWYNYDPAYAGESWEEYDPYDYSKAHAQNYEVDFKKDNLNYSVVYTSNGKKVLIRRSLTSDAPQVILDGINKTRYKNWKLGKEKEEIFKNEENTNMKIYKLTMTKGNEKHILYFKQDGRLMKIIKSN